MQSRAAYRISESLDTWSWQIDIFNWNTPFEPLYDYHLEVRYENKNSEYLKGTNHSSLGDIFIFATQQFRYFWWLLFSLIFLAKSFHGVSKFKKTGE